MKQKPGLTPRPSTHSLVCSLGPAGTSAAEVHGAKVELGSWLQRGLANPQKEVGGWG